MKILQPSYVVVEWGGWGPSRYSPGAPSALTQIVHYSSFYYTVFHSVIYNSVLLRHFSWLSIESLCYPLQCSPKTQHKITFWKPAVKWAFNTETFWTFHKYQVSFSYNFFIRVKEMFNRQYIGVKKEKKGNFRK